MQAMVLGGTGLTGPHTVRRLAELGHDVRVFHRSEPPAALSPDVVVHMWAMTEADARAFLDRFRGRAGRAVVISSGDVYRAYGRLTGKEPGPPDPSPLDEDAPLRESRHPYGTDYDKVLVEQVCRSQSEMPVTVLRFPAVYGPNDSHHRFGRWLGPMLAGAAELKYQADLAGWRWTHGYSEDLAEAVVLAATDPRAAGRVYNVGESETPTWAERLAGLAAAAQWRGRIVPVPAEELPAEQRFALDTSQDLVMDTRRIREELGYRETVEREDGYRRTAAWERLCASLGDLPKKP
jgi:nucleoside-diphosphate-sugar epimerase